jgi:hypothetical protein
VSDWFRFLVLEVSTIAIPGQRLRERGGWIIGDVQIPTIYCPHSRTSELDRLTRHRAIWPRLHQSQKCQDTP